MRINWLGVIISAIIIVLLRHLWYAHFGGADWGVMANQAFSEIRDDTTLAGKELLNALILSAVLGWLLDATRSTSLAGGFGVGFAAALGFALTTVSTGYIHGAPLKSFLIDGGYLVVAYVLAGAILGAMAPRRSGRSKFEWSTSEGSSEH